MMSIKAYIQHHVDSHFDGELPFPTIHRKVKKGTILTDFGQLETKVYFIKKGIIQVEIESPKELRVLDFFFENGFCASYSSLLSGKASDVSLKAVADSELEVISYADLQQAYQHSLIANKLGRIATERLYARRVLREKLLFTENAQENYLFLTSTYPEFIQYIPLKDIARYLGITPESLSRIRKNITS